MKDIQRRTLLRRIGATGAFLAVGGAGTAAGRGRGRPEGTGAEGSGPRQGASAEDGIVATDDELGFSALLTAVNNAEPVVAETLTNDDQYTVFAPTNAAFDDFFATVENQLGLTQAELLADPDGLLTNTLLYHVTEGRRYAASVVNAPEIETFLGESFAVDGTTLGAVRPSRRPTSKPRTASSTPSTRC